MITHELDARVALSQREVQLLRWPVQQELREECKTRRVPRILVVEACQRAPVCEDIYEDWVRTPVAPQDLRARADALLQRYLHNHAPQLDGNGVLRFASQSVLLSPMQAELLCLLVSRFGHVVPREALRFRLGQEEAAVTRNALDLHMMRIRQRISPLGLAIRTVWGRGYVLESAIEEAA